MGLPSGRAVRITTASLALIGLSTMTVVSLASTAMFTDSTAAGAGVASGSVDISVAGSVSTGLAAAALAPGDATYAHLTVSNSGTLALRYSGTLVWSASNPLSQSIQISVRAIPSGASACDASLAWGTGDVATNVSAPGLSAALFGSASTGQNLGDRPLSAATSETFCIRELLPASAGNAVASMSSAVSIQLDAEQTANN